MPQYGIMWIQNEITATVCCTPKCTPNVDKVTFNYMYTKILKITIRKILGNNYTSRHKCSQNND